MGETPLDSGVKPLKIGVVGPGAIGCLFGGMLSRAGHEVWLVDRRPERASVLDRRGVWISGVTGELNARVRATAAPQRVGEVRLAIVAVKSYDTEQAARAAAALVGPQTAVLTVQNGLGNVEVLARLFGKEHVIGGVTSQGATLMAPGQVRHAGSGTTIIGEVNGRLTERLRDIAAALDEAGLHAELTTDLPSVLWGKLAVNAGVNAVASLAGVRNGGILESRSLRGLLRAAVEEVARVAAAKGIELPRPDMPAYAEEVCQRTADNINSMLQDMNRKRRTEVDAINGAVVQEGESAGVPTPANAVLAALIRGIQDTYAARVAR